MELEITWGRTLHVWWAYVWRNLIAMVVGALLGAVVGAGLGFVLGVAGVAPDVIRRLSFVIGLALGLVVSIAPIRMVLGKDFGEFRLVLLANTTSPAHAGLPR